MIPLRDEWVEWRDMQGSSAERMMLRSMLRIFSTGLLEGRANFLFRARFCRRWQCRSSLQPRLRYADLAGISNRHTPAIVERFFQWDRWGTPDSRVLRCGWTRSLILT